MSQNGLDGLSGPTAYSGAPDYTFTGYDPSQNIQRYPMSNLPPGQDQLYQSRYNVNSSQITPEDENVLNMFVPDGVHLADNNVLEQQSQQLPSGTWFQSGGQYDDLYLQQNTLSPNQLGFFQPQGINDSSQTPPYSAQYNPRPFDPQRTPAQHSPLGGDEWIIVNQDNQNRPRIDSAQTVLQRSLQKGWLDSNGQNGDIPTVNGESRPSMLFDKRFTTFDLRFYNS